MSKIQSPSCHQELQDFCLPLDAERLQELCESLEAHLTCYVVKLVELCVFFGASFFFQKGTLWWPTFFTVQWNCISYCLQVPVILQYGPTWRCCVTPTSTSSASFSASCWLVRWLLRPWLHDAAWEEVEMQTTKTMMTQIVLRNRTLIHRMTKTFIVFQRTLTQKDLKLHQEPLRLQPLSNQHMKTMKRLISQLSSKSCTKISSKFEKKVEQLS